MVHPLPQKKKLWACFVSLKSKVLKYWFTSSPLTKKKKALQKLRAWFTSFPRKFQSFGSPPNQQSPPQRLWACFVSFRSEVSKCWFTSKCWFNFGFFGGVRGSLTPKKPQNCGHALFLLEWCFKMLVHPSPKK